MEEEGHSSVFVVDRDRRLQGLVTVDDAILAVQKGVTDLRDVVIRDVPQTTPDTYLEELLGTAATSKWPIAVVDDRRVLLGVIPRVAVLAALAGPLSSNGTEAAERLIVPA
jgi:glycine betaine/proline transport system ATP-binding protein